MRLVLREKRLHERAVAGSSLGNQAHVSADETLDAVTRFESHDEISTFNRNHTKPSGFYTSTAVEKFKRLKSDWRGYMYHENYGSVGCILLLKVSPSAKIAEINNTQDYMELLKKYGVNPLTEKKFDLSKAADPERLKALMSMPSYRPPENYNLNFDAIAKDFDGFRITRSGVSAIQSISSGWDVEQTVWFNTKVLQIIPAKEDSEINVPDKDFHIWYDEKYNFANKFEEDYPD
jgi:hypothetical protein